MILCVIVIDSINSNISIDTIIKICGLFHYNSISY